MFQFEGTSSTGFKILENREYFYFYSQYDTVNRKLHISAAR